MGKTFKDVAESVGPLGRCGGCCGCVIGFVLIILFGPAAVIQLGQKKYGLARNKISGVVNLDESYAPGRYWLGFWSDFLEFHSTLNTIEFSDEMPEEGVQHLEPLRSRDSDGKQIWLDVSVQYRLKKDKIGQLYREYNNLYENVYVSALRDALTKACNQFTISRVWEDYKSVNTIMKAACVQVLESRHAECWDLQLWRVRLDDRYEAALVRTQVRKQAQETEKARSTHSLVRAQTQVILAEYRANVTELKARADSSKYQIEKEAEAEAAGNMVMANAQILTDIKGTLIVRSTNLAMTESEQVQYRHIMMLQDREKAHMVYSTDGISGLVNAGMDARNIQAMRAISSRRLGEL